MEKFYNGLAQYFMVDRLIIKVRVKRKRSGFANYTDKRHHGVSADLLARKWDCNIQGKLDPPIYNLG